MRAAYKTVRCDPLKFGKSIHISNLQISCSQQEIFLHVQQGLKTLPEELAGDTISPEKGESIFNLERFIHFRKERKTCYQ
jgi:hypothetical protein